DGSITLSYTYTLQVAPDVSGTDTRDDFTVQAKDRDGDSHNATVSIKIVDDAPLAVDDTNSIEEDATAPTTGNVITGGAGKDTQGADGATVSGVAAGDKAANGGTDVAGQVAADVEGQYGTLVLDADGSYSYALDNTNLDVQGLTSGESLTETYTYTITDADGDTSTATLTITIHGTDDGVTVTIPPTATDTATTPDGNANDLVVFESGLTDGSQPGAGDITVDSTIELNALDGLDPDEALTLTYMGRDGSAATLVLTKAELEALSSTPKTLSTEYGALELKGYAQAADGSITLSYT
ncbi:VCBS domain-containing protein, partial [Pantoea sp. 18069]|uniref:VCBS domain-containing protein n=1 Tax=Pantoea sp. 18069 TaxID=2681415 RepID=UPI00190FA9AF